MSVKIKNKLNIRNQALSLLKECNITETPIRLSPIIKHLEISVQPDNSNIPALKKISAFIDLEDKLLIYNDNHPVVRKRFSVAHELGHYTLKHTIKNDNFNLNSSDHREIEANIFAAELLIPFEWIKKDLKITPSIPKLAIKYWVSEIAMGWRITKSDALTLS